MENYLFSEQHRFDLKVSDKLLRKYFKISSSKTRTELSHANRVQPTGCDFKGSRYEDEV